MRRIVLALTLAWLALPARADDAIPRPEHPEPMAVREHWSNLNGPWEFRFDADDAGLAGGWEKPGAEGFDRTIVVPFGWESKLSGIGQPKDAPKIGWYRRKFRVPDDFPKGDRNWLRFGAVDWRADVWVNGTKVAEHEGGYTPFEADITDALAADGGENTVVVRAFDPTDPSLPTGKQVGWYTPTSGIWQTAWLESRPKAYISGDFAIVTTLDPPKVTIRLNPAGSTGEGEFTVAAVAADASMKPAEPVKFSGKVEGPIELTLDVKGPKPWSPESPHLYDLTLELNAPDGTTDRVKTYFGLRTIARGKFGDAPYERVILNGKPVYLRLALDQSFNPEGVYTAPTDEFLRKDLELAKSVGLNGLRIHIKPDEPRRLYWADKLGLLIMEDMPNTWKQDERARASWEPTMVDTVKRDRNHPSIFAWVAFNETWGLDHPDGYKQDKDTQDWVKQMVAAIRGLDPTRLVEDNSPCYYDHVSVTDLNSWHFYIDDHPEAARHIDEVVAKSVPGSPFNHCPGEAMNSAPLINSEYGSVSAGGGDRDVSWGFRDLTNLLRKQPKIQGYVYTELTDIEWEHNGFADYDRTPKRFGYDAFVPGMTPADLQGADFVGYDGPPAIVAEPGQPIEIRPFVSHFSEIAGAPRLRWWIKGVDDAGEPVELEPRERPAEWSPYDVTMQKRIVVRLNTPFVGAVGMELLDAEGQRLAANFQNIVVRPAAPAPRIERIDDRTVALRFAPGDFARRTFESARPAAAGKAHGQGAGSFEYRLQVPKAVAAAKPEAFTLRVEASSKAGREKVDWAERVNAQDYPQTDATAWPSTLAVALAGAEVGRKELADDPADARGVLSHLAKAEHGSYGELVTLEGPLPEPARAAIAAGEPLVLKLEVPADAAQPGGLSIFGANTGAIPGDPVLLIRTADPLPADLGVAPDQAAAVDTFAARVVTPLSTGEGGNRPTWAFTTDDPGDVGWKSPEFDDSSWRRGAGGFGTPRTPTVATHTRWQTPAIWLRKSVDLPAIGPEDELSLRLFHDEDVAVFVNGQPLFQADGYTTAYRDIPLGDSQKALFRAGSNLIAVACKQTGGGQGIDLGLVLFKGE